MKYLLLILPLFFLNSCNNKLECDDLLQRYAEKIKKVEFIECKKGKGQTILQAKYKVLGKNSEEIENELIKKYGIGELKFTCCGWESTDGKNGIIENEELKKINPNYTLQISMFGNAEKKDENGKIYLELDKSKVNFYVIVEILDV